jgi:GWxTD domain-containing protein
MKLHRNLLIAAAACGALLIPPAALTADKKGKQPEGSRETVAKPLSEKERRRREEKLRKELEGPYRKWLSEDVLYIITDEERTAFKRLATDEEREQFIEQFWLRRDPSPDSQENEFKEEHYRRIAYANERYASGIPGWKTDRGRIYITFGPPDEIESHPSGGTYERPFEEGGGTTSTFPFEKWRYRWIQDIGSDIMIEFVDPTMTGEYRMTMDPS